MQELAKKMILDMKEMKISASTIEKELGFANGYLGKILKDKFQINEERFNKLKGYLELKKTDRQLSEFASTLSLRSVASAIQKEEAPDLPPKFNPKVEEIKSSIEGLTTADKIPPPAPKVPEWVGRVEKYCSKEGISPDDLIIAHKTLMSNFSPVEVKTSKIKDVVDNIKKATEKALESKESAAKFLSDAGITENKNSPKYDRRKVKLGF